MKISITKKYKHLAGIFIFLSHQIQADTRLVFNFSNLPQPEIAIIQKEFKAGDEHSSWQLVTLSTPGGLAADQIEQTMRQFLTPKLSGFPLLYSGYVTVTDTHGLATFPLRHAQPKLYIAITPDIKMIHVRGSSFSHAEYSPEQNTPLSLYKCEKLEDDKKQPFWKVSKITHPDSNRINPITVVILTNPDNIFIPEGDIMTPGGEQLITPPIRVIGNQDKEIINLRLLDIKPYFEQVQNEQKRANDTTVQKITTTF
ncbi:hypothetical protein FJ364_03745 [Candidatus Dependentiae bacterium]|nr:hypothetical protein [Candidatus Dependentiae bacterium]